ncbi:hypothetical protein RRG08_055208 [Elysia crispata]|uniref:Uncharacterized protein n=1 Tax=Elysia crispata TaxID=231223 RepID=A0AAE0XU14_9GAST|nr:hypothetical protein RRG08_055208 [Elysia crispata]
MPHQQMIMPSTIFAQLEQGLAASTIAPWPLVRIHLPIKTAVAAPSPPHVVEKVRDIYERLTAPELLQRCLKGVTQNANEAIHSTIWSRCPKHLFAGGRRVEIATTIAVGNFNNGSTSLRELTKECGCGAWKISIAHGL